MTLKPEHLENFDAFRTWLMLHLPAGSANLDLCTLDAELLEWAYNHIVENSPISEAKRTLLEIALGACKPSNGHAPTSTLVESAPEAKIAGWWNEIDECLAQSFEETGQHFQTESCAHLVWFAVEWRAAQLATMLRSIFDTEHDEHDE